MIIGLTGFKQSGKSTAAKYLEEKYGFVRHNFKDALVVELREGFPDLLKEIAYVEGLYHWEDSLSETGVLIPYIDKLFEEKPLLMRALMQNYGTNVRRGDDPDYWVKEWEKNSYIQDNIVVDDVRFLNEANKIKERGGIIIRIIRTDITTGGDHVSETEMLEIIPDYTIEVAMGEHEKMYNKLDEICRENTMLRQIIKKAFDPKNAVELSIEMPSHDDVFMEIAGQLNKNDIDKK